MTNTLLHLSDPDPMGLNGDRLRNLECVLERHIRDGRYEGCQIAVARHGSLILDKTFGSSPDISGRGPLRDDSLFCIRSITKVLIAAVIWSLAEEGKLSFFDRVVDFIPEFAAHGKDGVTLYHLLTHQAGFPNTDVSEQAWTDHAQLRKEVSAFFLEFSPGSRIVYHRFSAHWVLAAVIEAVTGRDFREVVRERIIVPLEIQDELFIGAPDHVHDRIAREHSPPNRSGYPTPFITLENTPEWYRAGHPGGGGVATARALVTFFQILANGGEISGKRLFSRRMIEYACRVHTGERINELVNDNVPEVASYGLGVYVRGRQLDGRVYGSLSSPTTIANSAGLNGVVWSDPDTGISMAYLNNCYFLDKRWIFGEMDRLSNVVHAALR